MLSTCSFLSVAFGATTHTFKDYEKEFGRTYNTHDERERRMAIFETNLLSIIEHNKAGRNWQRGVGDFTDRTTAEVRTLLPRGFDKQISAQEKLRDKQLNVNKHIDISMKDLPTRVDWREHSPSIITPVKNQGNCGSCWAFASTETLESHAALKRKGRLEEYSEQLVLDCTPNPHSCGGTGACQGGTAALAYDQIKDPSIGGMASEWTYPYTSGNAGTPGKCHNVPLIPAHPHFGNVSRAVSISGRVAVTPNSYEDVMKVVATVGPVTITVDAGGWHDYESGVFSGGNHTNPDLDHLVQLVGYGTDDKTGADYWLVRNSWTALWGENGYIRLARYGAKGKEPCGVDLTPMDGDGCEGGAKSVKVCGTSGVLYDAAYPIIADE